MGDYDSDDEASEYDAGVPMQFEFVDAPALVGEDRIHDHHVHAV